MNKYTFVFRFKGKERVFYVKANSLDEAVGIRDQMGIARYEYKTPGYLSWLFKFGWVGK